MLVRIRFKISAVALVAACEVVDRSVVLVDRLVFKSEDQASVREPVHF